MGQVPTRAAFLITACFLSLPISTLVAGVFLLLFYGFGKSTARTVVLTDLVPRAALLGKPQRYCLWGFVLCSLITGVLAVQPLFHLGGWLAHYLLPLLLGAGVLRALRRGWLMPGELLFALGCFSILLCLIGLANYFLGWTYLLQAFQLPWFDQPYLVDLYLMYPFGRARSFVMHPNILGLLMALSLPLWGQYWLLATTRGQRFFFLCLGSAHGLCLLVTFSRAAWLAAGLGLGVWLLLRRKEIKWQKLSLMLALLVLGGLISGVGTPVWLHLQTLFQGGYHSNFNRFWTWLSAWEMVQAFPFFGVGILNLELQFPAFQLGEEQVAHLHNWYLQVMVESGVPAALCFFGLVFGLWGRPRGSVWRQSLWCSLLVFFLASLFDYTLVDFRVMLYLVGVVSLYLFWPPQLQGRPIQKPNPEVFLTSPVDDERN